MEISKYSFARLKAGVSFFFILNHNIYIATDLTLVDVDHGAHACAPTCLVSKC